MRPIAAQISLRERHQRVSAVEGSPGGIGALAQHARPAA
jgi:hypothetical protein